MPQRPVTVTAAAALEAVEGLGALGFGVFVSWQTAFGEALDQSTAIAVAAMALLGGACMLAVARGLLRADRWSRSPAVLTQLFALPVSWSLLQSDQLLFGVPLITVAVLTLGLVLSGPSTAWLVERPSEEPAGENEEAGT